METNFGPLSSKNNIKLEFDIIVMFLPFHCLGLFNDKNTKDDFIDVRHQNFSNSILSIKLSQKVIPVRVFIQTF